MRARNIKPGFYRNEQLADCSSWARLLFPGLWMLADRCGRLEFRPKRWKAELFPYDNVDIEALFSELEAQGLVVKYESGSMNLVWIPHFLDHQKPHKNERGSVLLPHPDDTRHNQGNDEQCSDDEDGTALVVPEHNQGCADEQPWPLPARLIPDSSLPESKKEENTGGGDFARTHEANSVPGETGASTEEQPTPASKPKRTDSPSKGNPEWAGFQSCYEVYPVQQGKEVAWSEWMRLRTNGTLAAAWEIRDAILLLKAEDSRWQRGKVPKMARWLSEKGWDDKPFVEPAEMARASPQAQRPLTAAQERRALMAQNSQDVLKAREALRNDSQSPYSHRVGGNVRALPSAEA